MGKVRNFRLSDWRAIEDPVEETPSPENLELAKQGVAVTYIDSCGIAACGGMILYDDNNGEIWFRISRKRIYFPNTIEILRITRECFDILVKSFKDINLWCRVKQGFVKGEELINFLGFKFDRAQDGYGVYLWHKQP